jgi:hypothetical protein
MKYEVMIRLLKYFAKKKISYSIDSKNDCEIHIVQETEDLPIHHRMVVSDGPSCIAIFSHLGFDFQEARRMDLLLAVTMANYSINDGCFDMDLEEHQLFYRILTCVPKNGKVDHKLIDYLLVTANHNIDYYNDLFYLLSENKITLEDFYRATKNYLRPSF